MPRAISPRSTASPSPGASGAGENSAFGVNPICPGETSLPGLLKSEPRGCGSNFLPEGKSNTGLDPVKSEPRGCAAYFLAARLVPIRSGCSPPP